MKIAVISTPVFRLGPMGAIGYSGLEHLAWQRAKGLAERGHQVTLMAPDGSVCPGANVFHVGPERQVDEKMAYGKYWQVLLNQDVIIDETWQKWSFMLKQEGRLKAPVLAVCHAPVNTMYEKLPPIEKPCFVCISEDQRMHFESLFGRPARCCYNGVDTEYYKPLGIPRSKRFLFLARFSSIKGADIAIEACRKADAELDLVGDTSITNEPDYLNQCKNMCDGKKIRMVGPATRGECVYWFSQARALIHPVKRFREPFGLAPVEAMACSCPVIAWRNGAMKETLDAPYGGAIVDSEEQLTDVIHKWNEYNTQPFACRANAERFSLPIMIKRIEELCLEAIQTGGW